MGLRDHSLLFITIDTLRADRLGSYGDPGAETPHLDALARDGVRFASCYSSVPLTLPSHVTMFTGRYPFTVDVRTNGAYFLPEDEVTLAEVLSDAGFETFAAVGAYVLASKFGLRQGFGVYDDSLGTRHLFHAFESEIPADRVYEKFDHWLRDYGGERFFAWIHFYDPHLPYEPPPGYLERFREDPYGGEIAFVDSQVGRVVDELRARGLLEQTFVVIASDHGEAFGEHGEEGHGLMCYEETIRVPLIFYAPGKLDGGRVIRDRVHLMDLMPTLLDLFSIDGPTAVEGKSFAHLLRGDSDATARPVYFESMAGSEFKNWAPLTGIIVDQYKYISLPRPELYDLEADPGEKENLYRRRRQLAARLQRELDTLVRSAESEGGASRRQLSPEDRRHLRALGYLSSSASRSAAPLDPKRGMAIEMTLRRIRATINEGDLGTARRTLDSLIAENPDVEMPDMYELRHDIARGRGEEEAALAALEEGLSKFPDLKAFRFKLALYLFHLERYGEAERMAGELLAVDPRHSQALVLLGRIAESRGDLETALAHFEKAATLEPRSIPLQSQIADILARTDRGPEALEVYHALLAEGALDDDADKLYKAAMLNVRFGDLELAEELFRRGLDLEPGGVHHLSFALLLGRRGKTAEAIQHLETALQDYRHDLTPQQVDLAAFTLEQWRRAI